MTKTLLFEQFVTNFTLHCAHLCEMYGLQTKMPDATETLRWSTFKRQACVKKFIKKNPKWLCAIFKLLTKTPDILSIANKKRLQLFCKRSRFT